MEWLMNIHDLTGPAKLHMYVNSPVCQEKYFCYIISYSRWIVFWECVSLRTINRRLNKQGLRARWLIKRPLLSLRIRRAGWNSSRDHLRWNIRDWKRIRCSDESRLLFCPVDGRIHVWRHRNIAFYDRNVISKAAFDGGSVTVWVAVLLIVNYTYMSYCLTSMAFHTVTTWLTHTL